MKLRERESEAPTKSERIILLRLDTPLLSWMMARTGTAKLDEPMRADLFADEPSDNDDELSGCALFRADCDTNCTVASCVCFC